VVHTKSSKQKLNTKSSTESELVGISDYVPYTLWMNNFLAAQIKTSRVYQNNQSAIRMETNGLNSCTGNSRHVDIRYFLVQDRVDRKEIEISYCPTESMLADFFTKPLQGTLFRSFRAVPTKIYPSVRIILLKCIDQRHFTINAQYIHLFVNWTCKTLLL